MLILWDIERINQGGRGLAKFRRDYRLQQRRQSLFLNYEFNFYAANLATRADLYASECTLEFVSLNIKLEQLK